MKNVGNNTCSPAGSNGKLSAIVVSLPKSPAKRPGPSNRDYGEEWLESCYKSWRNYSDRIISVSEASPSPRVPAVEWRKVSEKPAISEIIATLARDPPGGNGFVLLTNADILLGPDLKRALSLMEGHILYYCSRVDVRIDEGDPRVLNAVRLYRWGYDAFFFPPELIARMSIGNLVPGNFRIGDPWWDFVVPIAALLVGFSIKKFLHDPHFIVHLEHRNTSNMLLEENGRLFLGWLRSLLRLPPSPTTKMIAEFVRSYDEASGSEKQKLIALANRVRHTLP